MRQTIKEIQVNIAYRWYIGYGFDEQIPHFSTFGKNYKRRFEGTDIFDEIFKQILAEITKCNFLDEENVFVDEIHIKASANTACDKNNFVLRFILTPGNYHDSSSFAELYQQVTTSYPNINSIVADSGYRTPAIAKLIIDDNRTPIFPYKRPMTKDGFFKKYEYVYDEYYDCYICPNNEVLKSRRFFYGKKKIVSESKKKVIQDFLAEYQPKAAKELQEILKDLMADTVQSMLEAKIEDELGYSKYDYQNKETSNSRNGYYPKTITASDGEFVVDIPRDREGIFEPKVVKKYENDIYSIEDKILSMYAKEMTTRDIQDHIKDIYLKSSC